MNGATITSTHNCVPPLATLQPSHLSLKQYSVCWNWTKTMFVSLTSIGPWGLPIIDLGRPPSWADIYFGCRVASVCPVCWDKKCVLQKQLAQSPGHLSSIANITPPGHRVNTPPPPPPRPRTAHPAALHYTAGISPKYPHTTRRVVQVLNLNTH